MRSVISSFFLLSESNDIPQDTPLDLQCIWSRIDKDTKPADDGRNGLIKLAIHMFAVVANSAGCERAFSNFGITHTKLRNKIDAVRVHKMAVVGMALKCVDREAGLARNRKKRKFGMDDTMPSDLLPTNPDLPNGMDSDDTEFRQYAENLIREAEISRDDDDLPEDIIPPSTIPTLAAAEPQTSHAPRQQRVRASASSSSSSRKTQIPLANLFNYTLSPDVGLEFYWPGSKKNLDADLVAHELAAAEEVSESSSTQLSLNEHSTTS